MIQKKKIITKNIKFSFHFSAFERVLLEKNKDAFEKIIQPFLKKNFIRVCYLGQPTRKQTITLLRSPHIDKKSREQFFKKNYTSTFICIIKNWKIFELFFFLIQKTDYKGIAMNIEWEYMDFFPKM